MARGRFSAKKRVQEEKKKSGFQSRTLDLQGLDLFKIDSDESLYLDIAGTLAGKGNPYTAEGDGSFERTYWVHRGLGPDGRDTVPCAAKNEGKPCPVCERINELRKSSDPDAETELKSLLPKQRQLFLVRDVVNDDKWKIWDVSPYLFGKLLNGVIEDLDEDEADFEHFPDPEDGYTLKISLNEKSFAGNSYYEAFGIGFKKRKAQYTIADMDALPCLDDMVKPAVYDEVKALLNREEPLAIPAPAPKAVEKPAEQPAPAPEPAPEKPSEPAPEASSDDDDDWQW